MQTVKIAIIGFGKIGSGVAEVLESKRMLITARTGLSFEIGAILDIRDFSQHPLKDVFVKTVDEVIADSSISAVVETVGGVDPSFQYVTDCLKAKKHVVTANKELIAKKGAELLATAHENGVKLLFEAAVGGTSPLIGTMVNTLSANSVERIDGILNGTTNFILTNMFDNKISYDKALEKAQRLGYAEPIDPSADVDGLDAQRKISILASIAYGKSLAPEDVETKGIRDVSYEDMLLADLAGGTVKLIASATGSEYGDMSAAVRPMFVKGEDRFATVTDVYNLVRIKADPAGDIEVYGKGAGKLPTAGVIVSDLIDALTREDRRPPLYTKSEGERKTKEKQSEFFVAAYSEKEEHIERIKEKIEVAAESDGGVGFFTGRISDSEINQLKGSLSDFGIDIKIYPILSE